MDPCANRVQEFYDIIIAKKARMGGDIGAAVFLILPVWQICAVRLGLGHVILAPTPELVF